MLPDTPQLVLFLAAGLLLAATPGPAVFYIVARSVEQGSRTGIISAAGVVAGALVHVVAASLGLSMLVLSSAVAFGVVKYLGALYLVYLGVRTLLRRGGDASWQGERGRRHYRLIFRDAMIINVFNPKVALFFVAFLPQFVDPARGSPTLQFLLLGSLLVTLAFVSDVCYALGAGTVSRRLREGISRWQWHRWLAGAVYLGLGAVTALAEVPAGLRIGR